jgi:NAD(P)-dependent dehydrogenase (short-subunit alcohol dehydrogenase family)
MRKRGGGSIISISSIFGLVGSAGSTAYHGSKGAVRLLTKAAAVRYGLENIRVNSIYPGLIYTPPRPMRRSQRVSCSGAKSVSKNYACGRGSGGGGFLVCG